MLERVARICAKPVDGPRYYIWWVTIAGIVGVVCAATAALMYTAK